MKTVPAILLVVLGLACPLQADDDMRLRFKLLPLGVNAVDAHTIAATEEVFQRRLAALGMEVSITPGGDTLTVDVPASAGSSDMQALLTRPGILSFRVQDGKTWKSVLVAPPIKSAEVERGPGLGAPQVHFEVGSSSVDDLARVTHQYVGHVLAIYVDEEQVSAPRLEEPIETGNCVVAGHLTPKEALRLAALLNGGPLQLKVEVLP